MSPVERAEADLVKYQKAVEELDTVVRAKEAIHAEKERVAGDEILAARLSGDPDAGILADLMELKSSAEISRRALVSARAAVIKGEAVILRAKAGVKRERVAELKAEIEKRQAHVMELLKPLQEFEERRFGAFPRINPATQQLEPGPSTKTQYMYVEMLGIENEAEGLEAEARRIIARAQNISKSGQ
ncbi:MAG: hypothetical protein NTY71_01700 [Methanoregula sp.]|nr:hypothetical protein [Methanoregula sp.]